MKKRIALVFLSTLLILAACNETDEQVEETDTEIPVEVSDIYKDDFTAERTYIARTMPSDMMPVILPSPGEVDELYVERGDTVEEGEVIAEIITPQQVRLEIEAPMDGVVQQLNLVEERMAANEEPAAMIVNIDPLTLSFNVPASEVDKFSVDDELTFEASANDESGTATITYVANSAGETGMYAIEAELENPSQNLLAGMTVQVFYEEVLAEDVLIVPTEAIVERGGEAFVYIVENGEAKAIDVEVIVMQTDETAIEVENDALDENSQLVTRGQLMITDGQKVRLVGEGQ
mgnify:FL=1